MDQNTYNAVKAATVAVVLSHPERPGTRNRPFTIVGSGFCIHQEGIVVTCEHVLRSFVDPASYERVARAIADNSSDVHELKGSIPHVVFYNPKPIGHELVAFPVPIQGAVSKTDFDLAVLRLAKHRAFRNGYPTLQIANYDDLHETMEIATCGFPLGEALEEQIGTVTSSFTKGMISSIIPTQGVARDQLKGFQLDLTATNGNSGGPVFSTASGHVFGVLQRGVAHPSNGHVVQGITKAEPIYPIFANDLIGRLLKGDSQPT